LVEQAISTRSKNSQQQHQQTDPKVIELTQKLNELNRDLSSKISALEYLLISFFLLLLSIQLDI